MERFHKALHPGCRSSPRSASDEVYYHETLELLFIITKQVLNFEITEDLLKLNLHSILINTFMG